MIKNHSNNKKPKRQTSMASKVDTEDDDPEDKGSLSSSSVCTPSAWLCDFGMCNFPRRCAEEDAAVAASAPTAPTATATEDMVDEDDPVWSNDVENAYFSFMLEEERERRAQRGKAEDDSLMGASSLREFRGQTNGTSSSRANSYYDDQSTYDDDEAMYSLATAERQPKTVSVINQQQSPEGPLDNQDKDSSSNSSSSHKQKQEQDPKADRRKRKCFTMVAIFSGILLALALALIIIVVFFDLEDVFRSSSKNSSKVIAANSNTEQMPNESVISLSPTQVPTFAPLLQKKTPPPDNFGEEDSQTQADTDSPTFMPTFAPTKVPDKSPPDTTPAPTNKVSTTKDDVDDDDEEEEESTTAVPTESPTESESELPTESPTSSPTMAPTNTPTTIVPTETPTNGPSSLPPSTNIQETDTDTDSPTQEPTFQPTALATPTITPTIVSIVVDEEEMPLLSLCQAGCTTNEDCSGVLSCYLRRAGDRPPLDCPNIDTASDNNYCVVFNKPLPP